MAAGGDECAEALRREEPRWRQFTTDKIWSLPMSALQGLMIKCLSLGLGEFDYFELQFHPMLYDITVATVTPWASERRCAGAEEEECSLHSRMLAQYGVRRPLPQEEGGGTMAELPDTVHLGFCVPRACAAHGGVGVLDHALPAWLDGAPVGAGAPSAHCCARLLGRHYWARGEIASEKLEPRLLRFQPAVGYDVNSTSGCLGEFLQQEQWFGAHFGAPLQRRLVRRRGYETLFQMIAEPGWESAESLTLQDHARCSSANHRYVGVQMGRIGHSGADAGEESSALRVVDGNGGNIVLEEPWGMCVPGACDDSTIFHSLLPAIPSVRRSTGAFVLSLEEQRPWSEVPLNFAVVGFAKCGTSSVAARLHSHPDIVMASCGEGADDPCEHAVYTADLMHDYMLPVSDLKRIQKSFAPAQAAPGAIRGIKDSRVLQDHRSVRRLAAVPGIKAVVVFRDPIDALESHYNHMQCWRILSMLQMAQHGLTDCLEGDRSWRGWGLWSERIGWLQKALPAGHVFVAHLEELAAPGLRGSAGWRRLLRFLGVAPAAPAAAPRRPEVRNRRRGKDHSQAVDLCSPEERPALQLLKRQYVPEYDRLVELLRLFRARVPLSLLERRTRCDRAGAPGNASGAPPGGASS